MDSLHAGTEAELLDRLQFAYEARGFAFERHPAAALLPDFLAGYAPDAVAQREGETVVIEVRPRSDDPAEAAEIARVADALKGRPGYRFELVIAERPGSGTAGELDADEQGLRDRLQTARRLLGMQDMASALIVAWSTLEGLVRARLGDAARGVHRPMTAKSLVAALVSFGLIEDEEEADLAKLAEQRNRFAHGDTRTPVDARQIEALIALIERILESEPVDHV
jgi:hypothetical protein